KKTLDLVKKDLTIEDVKRAVEVCGKNRIMTLAYFMIGFSWETEADILSTLDFAGNLGSDVVEFFFPYPLPGTELYDSAVRDGLIDDENPAPRTQQDAVFIPKGMSLQQLNQLRDSGRMGLKGSFRAARAMLRQAENPMEFAQITANSLAAAANALLRNR
ncbi:MAG: hypothetical protein GY846_22060, partial [Deltaproteobacteria bacterium]|nr:hypothetical protein [Deltaproteobacteria bacterium]